MSALFEYLCYGYTAIINILLLSAGIDITGQILVCKVDPHTLKGLIIGLRLNTKYKRLSFECDICKYSLQHNE